MLPAWIMSEITLVIILWLTLAPDPLGKEEIPIFPGADKIVHGLMFGFLTFVILLDWARGRDFASVRGPVCLAAALFSTAVGTGIEFLQRSMHMGRSFEIWDMVADAIGSFTVGSAWIVAEHCRKRHRAN